MEAPEARRTVIVDGVHLTEAAALLAFLRFEQSCNSWDVRNADRLASLVSTDGLLRALADDLLPRLVTNPASAESAPARNLISRCAYYIMASASAAGGTFAEGVTGLCNYILERAADDTTLHLMRRRAEEMLRGIIDFRSRHVAIANADPDPVPAPHVAIANADPDPVPEDLDLDLDHDSTSDGEDDLHLTTLRQALQEATAAPAADRRVYVDAVRANHCIALLAVLEFQATAFSWTVRNLGRFRAATTVAVCLDSLRLSVLRVLITDPNRGAALIILRDFADFIKEKAGTVGGDFMERTISICISLAAHGATAKRRPRLPGHTELMRRRAEEFSQQIAGLMSLNVSVDSGSDISSSTSASDSSTSDE